MLCSADTFFSLVSSPLLRAEAAKNAPPSSGDPNPDLIAFSRMLSDKQWIFQKAFSVMAALKPANNAIFHAKCGLSVQGGGGEKSSPSQIRAWTRKEAAWMRQTPS
jgi:hypothetical protein